MGGIKWAGHDGTTCTDGLLTLNGLREMALAEWPGLGNIGGNINRHIFPRRTRALLRGKGLISDGVARAHDAGVWLSRS